MESDKSKPILPKGIAYRHSLGFFLVLLPIAEFILYAAMMSTRLNNSSWTTLWQFCFLTLPIAVIWRGLWLEKHGWWKRRIVEIPELPAEFHGLDWKATFDFDQVVGQGAQLPGPPRTIRYADIKRVEFGTSGGLNIIESGKVPITLGNGSDNFLMVALLAHYAPQAEFRGVTSPMRDGWEPRF